MTSRKLASAAAAASLAGVAVLGMGAPAVAQTYPPVATPPSISDATVVAGQRVTVNSGAGSFDANSVVTVAVLGFSATVTADSTGNASFTFTVPADARPGRTEVTFTGVLAGQTKTVVVPFTVVAAAAAGPGRGQAPDRRGTALPRTGADQLVPLTIGGVALVGIGTGIVVVARRRRETIMPAGLA